MDTFYSAIKILIGIAILYFICDTLIISEKFKSYANLILGLAVAVTLIEPIGKLINSDWNISFNVSDTGYSDDYRENVENIWNGYSSDSLQKYVKNILQDNYGQYTFTVRTYKQENKTYRIYLTSYDSISDAEATGIKKLICDKTGISTDYVNIYLQNPQIKEDTQ